MQYPFLDFHHQESNSDLSTIQITLDPEPIEALYQFILKEQQQHVVTFGFTKGTVPLHYLEYTFKNNIIEHLKQFFFFHTILNFLYHNIIEKQIAIIGEPKLKSISLDLTKGGVYTFSYVPTSSLVFHDWKRLPFKQPSRKNYKDIDRQVEFFIEEEQQRQAKHTEMIGTGDWVSFEIQLVDGQQKPLVKNQSDLLWIKLGDEIVDRETYELFAGKKVGDSFTSKAELLQDYFNNGLDHNYIFNITIKDRVPYDFFSLDQFKKHFKSKTAKETHTKLIEVFSCRNDISQRRETVAAVFNLMFNNYPFSVPISLTQEQQYKLLHDMQNNPDYNVYKAQQNFKNTVRQLAEKQVKEDAFISSLITQEHISATDEDIVNYLNLIKRPRMKEFIHFPIPSFKEKGHEMPIPHHLLRYRALHEKTLNHLIAHLTK